MPSRVYMHTIPPIPSHCRIPARVMQHTLWRARRLACLVAHRRAGGNTADGRALERPPCQGWPRMTTYSGRPVQRNLDPAMSPFLSSDELHLRWWLPHSCNMVKKVHGKGGGAVLPAGCSQRLRNAAGTAGQGSAVRAVQVYLGWEMEGGGDSRVAGLRRGLTQAVGLRWQVLSCGWLR